MLVNARRLVAVLMVGGLGALLSSACVTNDSSIFVRGCAEIPKDTCEVLPSITAATFLRGSVDSIYDSAYDCVLLVENQLVERGDPTTLKTETSRVSLYEADVQVLDSSGRLIQRADGSSAEFSTPITGFVDPGTGDPGIGVANAVLLDFQTIQDLGAQAIKDGTEQTVVAAVIVHGRTLGGLEVHSNQFQFPITVCSGCKCEVPVGETCIGDMNPPDLNCRVGSDNPVDCRLMNPSQLDCPDGTIGSAQCPTPGQKPKIACNTVK